jgi:hypothetical protein
MDVWFWALFPFICVFLVFTLVGAARFIRWCKTRHEWSQHVRTQKTVFEQEEHELMMAAYEVDDED